MKLFAASRVWLALGAVCALAAGLVAWTGGIDVAVAGIPLRARSWERPAAAALICGLAGVWGLRRDLPRLLAQAAAWLDCRAWLLLAAAAGVAAFVSVTYATRVAGGSDSSGYVSQAALLARGHLIGVAPAFFLPDAPAAHAPLGYRPGAGPGVLVPTYPPGLPLLMAPAAAWHSDAVFMVVPLAAVLAVWLCGAAGRALGDPLAGALAAWLLATSPTFLYHAVQPMSDVPATACWLAALILACRPQRARAAAAGVAAAVAVLIRPNLAPLLVVPAVALATGAPGGPARLWCYVLGTAPGLLLLGVIQHARFGSALSSGYGPASDLFAAANVLPNTWQYTRWLTAAHGPFVWAALLAPGWLRRADGSVRRTAWLFTVFAAGVVLLYLPYGVFNADEWHYTRFLLPALPVVFVFGTGSLLAFARQSASAAFVAAAIVAVATTASVHLARASVLGVFDLWRAEHRYAAVARFVRDQMPHTALVLSDQHSGSVHYYSGRPILRWTVLDPASLEAVITRARQAGHAPIAVLDPFEDDGFRERFGQASAEVLARLRLAATVEGTRIYTVEE